MKKVCNEELELGMIDKHIYTVDGQVNVNRPASKIWKEFIFNTD